ncbi:GNAT family N-acetyltransferase [Haloparvum sedimenti]|uniref:GNAT family N-acetyltransferase n=1 Tax=Haloparvum sedimenti TaxID=1678448 RepID=UPI00071E6C96|nr:GNAT family N-acetyltransferase [Haloparvum sedimenti]
MTTTPTSTADRSADPTAERSPAPAPSPRGPRFVDKLGVRWRIRAADGDDRDALAAMYADFGTADRAQGLPPVTESRTVRWLDDLFERGWNVVAEGEAGVVGHATLTPTDADEPELAVFVHPAYQDRGLGTELCRHIVARAAATDRDAVVLTVERRNRAALSVYRGLGFETVEGERGDLWMRLPLAGDS